MAQSEATFLQTLDSTFNFHSLLLLVLLLGIALILGRLVAALLRRVTRRIAAQADKSDNLTTVNKLRRIETFIVLSIASVRALLLGAAIYFWWLYMHPTHRPSALLGAGAIIAIFWAGVLGPLLRDVAYGGVMMAEHWFGVGDHITIEPFNKLQGVVERVTLRSTRIRGLNGEVAWINNQNIQAVRVAPRGIRSLALELFVSNLSAGRRLIAQANRRLPETPTMVVRPLSIVSENDLGNNLWHLTVLGATTPGREWLLDDFAITIMKELDATKKYPCLVHEPIARFADHDAERRYGRTVHNALKRPRQRKKRAAKAA